MSSCARPVPQLELIPFIPHPVDICHQCTLFRCVDLLIVGPHPTLDCKQQHFQVAFLLESKQQIHQKVKVT